MIVTAADWSGMEDDERPGTVRRRLFPETPHDIFLAVRQPPRRRMLTLGLRPGEAVSARRLLERATRAGGIDLDVDGDPGPGELRLSLHDPGLVDVFNVLVGDVATHVAGSAPGDETRQGSAVESMFGRYQHWTRLLRSLGDEGLGPERRRGLVGELLTLRRLLHTGVPAPSVLGAWTGPDDADQDFQFPGLALEVKASAAHQPRTMSIASERQLDDTGVGCLLLSQVLLDERPGGEGPSLNDLTRQLRDTLGGGPAGDLFDDLLVRAGYLALHRARYDEPRYTVRDQTVWRVDATFPRIVETDLRAGVGSCSYRISTAGLEPYALTSQEFDSLAARLAGQAPRRD